MVSMKNYNTWLGSTSTLSLVTCHTVLCYCTLLLCDLCHESRVAQSTNAEQYPFWAWTERVALLIEAEVLAFWQGFRKIVKITDFNSDRLRLFLDRIRILSIQKCNFSASLGDKLDQKFTFRRPVLSDYREIFYRKPFTNIFANRF